MPLTPITVHAGINNRITRTQAAQMWWQGTLVRCQTGLMQKLGGWQRLTSATIVGTGRGMHGWADLAGNPYLAIGSEQRLALFQGGMLVDITPLRATTNPAPAFTTTLNSKTVQITDTTFGGVVGDWVNLIVPVAVGGLVLQGFYQIASVIDSNNYTITAASAATGTVAIGGAVPSFTTANTLPTVTVTLANHGLTAGAQFAVEIGLTIATIVIAIGSYTVTAPVTSNTFVIVPGGTANASTTASENSGNAQIEYLVPTGLASAMQASGYGIGPYGGGPYGIGSGSTIVNPLRQWFLDNWGQDLVGNYTNGPLYVWVPPQDLPAVQINTANFPGATSPPTIATASFVSNPAQILIALGTDVLGNGTQDPNLISWSDVGDFTKWVATTSNQAGSFRLPSGSRIVGGLIGPLLGYIWTDIDFWVMQYIGAPLVFGFNKIASGADLMGARAAAIYKTNVYWVTRNQFMVYDGNSVQVMPCTVWDFFFRNLDRTQQDKVHCAVNSLFGEVTWHFPSTNPANTNQECDSYVTYNSIDRVWYCGGAANGMFAPHTRTTWIDDNVLGPPIGVDQTGLLQQHETSPDADGAPMMEQLKSGFFSIAEGSFFTFMERAVPDFTMTGTAPVVTFSFEFQDYPSDSTVTKGPYAWGPNGPAYQIVRGRGRSCAINIAGTGLGTWWRFGAMRYLGAPAGRR